MLNALAIILHLMAINAWIGGTFFTVVILSRSITFLEPAQQIQLMRSILQHFFFYIWIAMFILLTSGIWMIYSVYNGLANIPKYIMLMMLIGLAMMVVFLVIYFGPYRLFVASMENKSVTISQKYLSRIRLLSILNMVLGICVLLLIGGGPQVLI